MFGYMFQVHNECNSESSFLCTAFVSYINWFFIVILLCIFHLMSVKPAKGCLLSFVLLYFRLFTFSDLY